MRKIRFVQADVFSDSPFGGNPVVVVPDSGAMTTEEMAALARGMAFSETAFVVAPSNPQAAFALRCFTPTTEVAFSGHQLLGAAYVLAGLGRLEITGDRSESYAQVGDGLHSIVLRHPAGSVDYCAIVETVIRRGEPVADVTAVAAALSLDPLNIARTGLPVQVVETGLACLLVPVATIEAIRDLMPAFQTVDQLLHDLGAQCMVAFSLETLARANTTHVRVFAPPLGINEDPATATANAALAAYLVAHGAVKNETQVRIRNEQGSEMGRPSVIEVVVDTSTEPMTMLVGGRVARSIEGTVFF